MPILDVLNMCNGPTLQQQQLPITSATYSADWICSTRSGAGGQPLLRICLKCRGGDELVRDASYVGCLRGMEVYGGMGSG